MKKRGMHPIFYGIAAVLVLLLIFGVTRIVRGAKNRTPQSGRPAVTAAATQAPSAVTPTPEGLPEATPTPVPTPTPEPTPTPSGAKATKAMGYIAPADWGCVLWPREKEVYDSFFDNSCMIGNSLVEGFFMYSGLTNIKSIYNTGATSKQRLG